MRYPYRPVGGSRAHRATNQIEHRRHPRLRSRTTRPLAVVLVCALVAALAITLDSRVARADEVVVRVNAGGPSISGSPTWESDNPASPYVNTGFTASTSHAVDLSDPSIPSGTPAAVFQTERWDKAGAPDMNWDLPVAAGALEVRLYFAETYSGTQSVGARVFDVTLEGELVLDNYDVYADVGGYAGVVKTFPVQSDGNVDIDFTRVTQNPAIKAIEVVALDGSLPGGVAATPATLEFPPTTTGSTSALDVELTNTGAPGDASVTIDATQILGADAAAFSDDFDDAGTVVVAPGEIATIHVEFTPQAAVAHSAVLAVDHDGLDPPLNVPLSGTGTDEQPPTDVVLYRVNAGGPAVAGAPSWDADNPPSVWSNAAAASSNVSSTSTSVDLTDPSVPAGTPMEIFQSERWDSTAGNEMSWHFPVPAGDLEVRLYFAETYTGTQAPGARVFDVKLEGTTVLSSYDVFAEVGGYTGVVKSFPVQSDGNVDIDFAHLVQNPTIKAIEIVQRRVSDTLGAAPASLAFNEVVVGEDGVAPVAVSNLGAAGDPSITVAATEVTGADASAFSDDFADGSDVVLAPGESTTIEVTFTPDTVGAAGADLEIAHSGSGSPLVVPLSGTGVEDTPGQISFGKSVLAGAAPSFPTTLDFGPDGRLYVGQQDGTIHTYDVVRNGADDYSVTDDETIGLVKAIPNHDDDGTPNPSITKRQVTGLLTTGTPEQPVLYVTSSDPRIGGGSGGDDTNLDTNSGILSRLTRVGSTWEKVDLVRGLPRSEENHSPNGLDLDEDANVLYIAQGGNTNLGAPSNNFVNLPEYALSAAILSVDLDALGDQTYDLPTLDDEDRPGVADADDPFGGNAGKNQAVLEPDGPVDVYAPGFRNPYDVVLTEAGRLYTIDNGSNAAWGDFPLPDGPQGVCTNDVQEPGHTDPDTLHHITGPGYYGGHPNPTRANAANTFNPANPQSPVASANPIECDYRYPGEGSALLSFPESTNGLTEFTASSFGGALRGDLLTASFDGAIHRMELDASGTVVTRSEVLFANVGVLPLDVTAQGDAEVFAGTIWVVDRLANEILVFEPSGSQCTGADDPDLDEDGDGYRNADEIDNGTNPCSAADAPADWDGDLVSNLNDPDDDDDGLPDTSDPFAIDADNGASTELPAVYTWDNDDPNKAGLLTLNFTGLMTNGVTDYEALFDPSNMTPGGAAGAVTIDEVPPGDAAGDLNSQEYGFQFGVDVDASSSPFTAHTRILAPFAGLEPSAGQSMGLQIGTGTQDDYVKLVVDGAAGGGVTVQPEVGAVVGAGSTAALELPGPEAVDLYLSVDPTAATVQASYTTTIAGVTSAPVELGAPIDVPSTWFTGATRPAVGIIATSRGAPTFPATWGLIEVTADPRPGVLSANPDTLELPVTEVGGRQEAQIELRNDGAAGDEDIVVQPGVLTGTDPADFDHDLTAARTLAPGEATTVTVGFAPQAAGPRSAALVLDHSGSGSPLTIPLTGTAVDASSEPTVLYRVNAGGPEVAGTADPWAADDVPSPWVNAGSNTAGTTQPIDVSDPSVPEGTPSTIFQRERWDPLAAPEMSWDFPVPPGELEVRLYFAETYSGTQAAGARVFDVSVEGQLVLDDYDVFARVGGYAGIVERFPVTSDGNVDIDFAHVTQNPTIKAIEIVAVDGGTPGAVAAVPASPSFQPTAVGATSSANVEIHNVGGPGDPAVTLTAATLTGGDAPAFSEDLSPRLPVMLQPGDHTTVTVGFTPSAAGDQSAALEIAHDGVGGSLAIPLTASAFDETPADAPGALFEVRPDGSLLASTYTPGSFRVTNQSQGGQTITSFDLDLSTALLPDLVFDPTGAAGDTTFKDATLDSGTETMPIGRNFLGPHDGGFDLVQALFGGFDPAETMTWSIDIDPTSIKGVAAPGPSDSGSVSGLEIVGATVTVRYDDGTVQTGQLAPIAGSDGGSRVVLRPLAPAAPGLSLVGVTPPVSVTSPQQTARLTGPAGATVRLTQVETGLYTAGVPDGGFDLDPFETNTAVAVQHLEATIGPGGTVDIPVTLGRSTPEAGTNLFVATVLDTDGVPGAPSGPVLVVLEP